VRRAAAVVALVLAALPLAACGDDDEGPAATSTSPSTAEPPASTSGNDATVQQRCGRYAPGHFAAVALESSDGVALEGYLAGSGTTGIVLAHQSNGDACGWLPYAATLEDEALVLALDLRGYGGSDAGPDASEGRRYDLDVLAAAGALRERGATRVVLMGASLGAASALAAASQLDPPPDAVVALSPGEELDGAPLAQRVEGVTWSTRIVAAEDDPPYPEAARALAEASGGAAEATVYEDGGHGWQLLVEGEPHAADVDAIVHEALTGG
jgi:hypothetical protein